MRPTLLVRGRPTATTAIVLSQAVMSFTVHHCCTHCYLPCAAWVLYLDAGTAEYYVLGDYDILLMLDYGKNRKSRTDVDFVDHYEEGNKRSTRSPQTRLLAWMTLNITAVLIHLRNPRSKLSLIQVDVHLPLRDLLGECDLLLLQVT